MYSGCKGTKKKGYMQVFLPNSTGIVHFGTKIPRIGDWKGYGKNRTIMCGPSTNEHRPRKSSNFDLLPFMG